jgi:hypothetical protein
MSFSIEHSRRRIGKKRIYNSNHAIYLFFYLWKQFEYSNLYFINEKKNENEDDPPLKAYGTYWV